jgi:hypothetical protein
LYRAGKVPSSRQPQIIKLIRWRHRRSRFILSPVVQKTVGGQGKRNLESKLKSGIALDKLYWNSIKISSIMGQTDLMKETWAKGTTVRLCPMKNPRSISFILLLKDGLTYVY